MEWLTLDANSDSDGGCEVAENSNMDGNRGTMQCIATEVDFTSNYLVLDFKGAMDYNQ